MESIVSINRLVSQPEAAVRHKTEISNALWGFIDRFADPGTRFGSERDPDEMRPLLAIFRESSIPPDIEILVAKAIKILLRKAINRAVIGKNGVQCVVKALIRQNDKRSIAAAEVGNVVLNTCYNGDNVQLFLDEGGLEPLLNLLLCRDTNVQASVLGAIQGICYVPGGRHAIRQDPQALRVLTYFLESNDPLVRARASGVVHNISADSSSIRLLRETECIPAVVHLLRDEAVEVCQASAGTLQNMSREVRARELILECEAIEPLTDLLFGTDVQCQVAAVGALFNLLLPSQGGDSVSLKRLLTEGLAMGVIQSAIFEGSADPFSNPSGVSASVAAVADPPAPVATPSPTLSNPTNRKSGR